MSKSAKVVVIVIVVAAIAIAAIVVGTSGSDETKNKSTETSSKDPVVPKPKRDKAASVTAVITYNGKSFSPQVTSIKSGDAITVTNQSHNQLDFGSDPHPTHTDEPELNAGDIKPGESKTFTVTHKGKWGFHNHFNPSQHAFIKVQ